MEKYIDKIVTAIVEELKDKNADWELTAASIRIAINSSPFDFAPEDAVEIARRCNKELSKHFNPLGTTNQF